MSYRADNPKKHGARLLALSLIVGVTTAVAISPAAAATTVASIHPDEDGTDASSGNLLSDRDDGTDSLAHLTAVADTSTDSMHWYRCPRGVAKPVPQSHLADCEQMGTDGSATVPRAPFTVTSEAYELTYDIPADLDQETLDVLVLACTGPGVDVEGPDANCAQSLEENIVFDDGATGSIDYQSPTGEMVSYCTSDTDDLGPTASGLPDRDPCNVGSGFTTEQKAAVAARFHPFGNGSAVPNNGFVVRATTSPGFAAGEIKAARDLAVGSETEPRVAEQTTTCTLLEDSLAEQLWECSFQQIGTFDDNVGQAVWLYENSITARGFCTQPRCALDAHYVASTSDRSPGRAIVTFVSNPPALDPCAAPDRDEVVGVPGSKTLTGCLTDAFGNPVAGPVTFESTGLGGFTSCGEFTGKLHDHNADGALDHCHTAAAADGRVDGITINNDANPGEQTITLCHDPQNGEPASPGGAPPAGHGCSDTTVKDSAVARWQARPTHIHLVFVNEGDEPSCHGGDTYRNNAIGDRDTLVACTGDGAEAENPATTDQPTGGFLRWSIDSTQGGEGEAIRFQSAPPTETDGSGQAIARIEAFRAGNATITVELCRDTGGCAMTATVQKLVTSEGTEEPIPSKVTIDYSKARGLFTGTVSSRNTGCAVERPVVIKKVRRGPDTTIGRVSTDGSAKWTLRGFPDARGRFYAKVGRKVLAPVGGNIPVCLADRSLDVIVRRS